MVYTRRKRVHRRKPVRKLSTAQRRKRNYKRKVKRYHTKPKLSVQRLKTFVPDIMLTKQKGTYTIQNYLMTNVVDAFQLTETTPGNNESTITSNQISLWMNASPQGGRWLFGGRFVGNSYSGFGVPVYAIPLASDMLTQTYNSFRPYGMKVKIRIIPADPVQVGQTGTSGPSPIQLGNTSFTQSPYQLSVLPYQNTDSRFGNYWNELQTPFAISCENISQTKYGKKRFCPGVGGKSSVVFSEYYDFAKLFSMTKQQYMTSDFTHTTVSENNNPATSKNTFLTPKLMIDISDYCVDGSQTRYCNVIIDTVQYSRWEGPFVQTH